MTNWPQWRELLQQANSNSRLRMGLLSVLGILWIYALLLASDQVTTWRTDSMSLREELGRIQPLAKERGWSERADDARQQLTAVRGMMWREADQGLIDAGLQDWIRGTASKAGLPIRELTVSRPESSETRSGTRSPQDVKARLTSELNRLALLNFLVEVGRNERVIVVDRFALRLSVQPNLAEIDLRILGSTQSGNSEVGR